MSAMDDAQVLWLVGTLLPLGLLAIWCAIVFLLSTIGGWRRLARTYRASGEPSGLALRGQTGKVGVVPYRRCLTVHAGDRGVYLSLPFPFRIGHPSLMIPWRDLHGATHARVMGRDVTRMEVGTPVVGRLELPANAVARMTS